jgi:hypothetical protein
MDSAILVVNASNLAGAVITTTASLLIYAIDPTAKRALYFRGQLQFSVYLFAILTTHRKGREFLRNPRIYVDAHRAASIRDIVLAWILFAVIMSIIDVLQKTLFII